MLGHLLFCLFGISACVLAGSDAIRSGTPAVKNQFPYQVSVQFPDHGHDCGGGILGDNIILSAASCVIGSNGEPASRSISILAGTNDLRETSHPPAVIRHVKRIYVPNDFSPRFVGTTGDLAILKLKNSLDLKENMHLRKLNVPNYKHDLYKHVTAVIAGFGWNRVDVVGDKLFGGREDTQLRFAQADVMDNIQCQEEHPTITISESHLCARMKQFERYTPRGVCVGDGGGPLVYDGVIIGIVAIGQKDCSEKNSSAIYTRVSHYLHPLRLAKANDTSKLRFYDLI